MIAASVPRVVESRRESEDASEDDDIRAACTRGDHRLAASLIVRRYGSQIRNYFGGLLHNRTRAEDAYSIFAVELLVALPKFRWEARPKAFAYAIAHHAACRYLKAERRYQPLQIEALCAVAAPVRTRTATYLRTEIKQQIRALRDRLSLDDQELLLLHVNRGLTFAEIARAFLPNGLQASDAELKTKANSLRQRYGRIRQHLTALARQEGLLE